MSGEESFVELGLTPTPSMVLFLESEEKRIMSPTNILEKLSLVDSNNLNPLKKGLNGRIVTLSEDNAASTASVNEDVLQPTIPIDEVEMLQQLIKEQDQMKEALQKKNVDLRNNIEDLKSKYGEQRTTIGMLEGVNEALQQALAEAEKRCREQRERAEEEKALLKKELEESKQDFAVERIATLAQFDELKKALSEKQSVLMIMSKEIERLKQERDELVTAIPNNLDACGSSAEFVPREEHDRQIKVLQLEISEFENMKTVHVDQMNCLRANLVAADKVQTKNCAEMSRMAKDIETKDVSLKKLSEQVNVLTAKLEEEKVQNKRISTHMFNKVPDRLDPSSEAMDSTVGVGWSVNIR